MTDQRETAGPLTGVRVVDLTHTAAGPHAAELLAFLGAEVIKVESHRHPDLFRRVVDRPELGLDRSPRFNEVNLNKASILLNIARPEGRDVLLRLVALSDVVIENFRPGVVERLGIAYDDLVKVKPDIIMVSISSNGRRGPESEHPGYASVFNALGGLGYLTGYPDGPPTEIRDSVDLRVGTAAAFAAMAALLHRQRTGKGQYVDLSAREVVSTLIGEALVEFAATGRIPQRDGNHLGVYAPYDVYPCAGEDEWVAIAVTDDQEWAALCCAMGQEWLRDDPRFCDAVARARHREELDALVTEWTRRHTSTQAFRVLREHGVPASTVMGAHELLEDPALRERGVFRTVEHPLLGRQVVTAPPWRFRSGLPQLRASPTFGQDTERVLRQVVGLTEEEFRFLSEAGVIE